MSPELDEVAERIAGRGRETLVARLRPAFQEAASAHADVLTLDDEQLEEMIQRAADRADGLQWRRALASVAIEELGIGLGEALGHPAVARAQEIVGAPSYEQSLAELTERMQAGGGHTPHVPAPAAEPAVEDTGRAAVQESPVPLPDEDSLPTGATEVEESHAQVPEPAPVEEAYEDLPELEEDGAAPVAEAHPEDEELEDEELGDEDEAAAAASPEGILRLAATHVSGIATLETPERGLELRLGEFGLDIARNPGRVIGRLRWPEIKSLEVPPPRGLRRRRRGQTPLLVRTQHGDATFEIPSVSESDLRGQLEPLLSRFGIDSG